MVKLLTLRILEGYTRPVVMVGKKTTCLIDTGADTPVWTRGSTVLQKEFTAKRIEGKVFILSGFGKKSEVVDVYVVSDVELPVLEIEHKKEEYFVNPIYRTDDNRVVDRVYSFTNE